MHLKRTAPEVERVDFVVSKKAKVSEHYREFTDSIRRSLETLAPIAAPLVGDLIPASMQERLPLQAADLLCWHLQRIKSKNADAEDQRNWNRLGDTSGGILPISADELVQISSRVATRYVQEIGMDYGTTRKQDQD